MGEAKRRRDLNLPPKEKKEKPPEPNQIIMPKQPKLIISPMDYFRTQKLMIRQFQSRKEVKDDRKEPEGRETDNG